MLKYFSSNYYEWSYNQNKYEKHNFSVSKFQNITNKHTALSTIRLKVITSHVFNVKWLQQRYTILFNICMINSKKNIWATKKVTVYLIFYQRKIKINIHVVFIESKHKK